MTAFSPVERGVTIVELAVAMSILALALGGIYGMISTGARSARVTNDIVQTQAQLRAGLDNVVDEMRWGQRVTAAGPTAVTLLVPASTPFSASSPYTVTFAHDAGTGTLIRQEDPDAGGPAAPGAAEPIAYSVVRPDGSAGVSFEYFDAAGASLGSTPAVLADIARVRIVITTTRDRVSRIHAGDSALRSR